MTGTHVLRLRPLPDLFTLQAMYPTPHDHTIYGRGHGERVAATIALAREVLGGDVPSVADLSCGNGAIARALCPSVEGRHLGDFASGLELSVGETGYLGLLEETLGLLPARVHTYVLSETLEHLDDPVSVLSRLRDRAWNLVLSTPLECWDDANGEHLWAWDRTGVEELLRAAGWGPWKFTSVDSREYGEPYLYGIWVSA